MKNNFRNCLSFGENKLFSSKFREPIIYYTIIKIKLSILMNCVSLRLDNLKRLSWSLYLSFNDVDYRQKPTSCCAFERYLIPVWIELLCVCVCVFFFFFGEARSIFSSGSCAHRIYKPLFSPKLSLKMGLMTLFTHLKIILLQCFQFSVK